MEIDELRKIVQNIAYPKNETESYFEWHSADGFAFLGAAKALLGIDFMQELVEVRARNYSLNHENYIGNILIAANAQYVYTLWACSEFLRSASKNDSDIDLKNELKLLFDRVCKIGVYPNFRMHRYCNIECNLIVPNATSAASLLAVMNHNIEYASSLLFGLYESQQPNHNWNYVRLQDSNSNKEGLIIRQEDCYHLAMIIYHLNEISSILTKLVRQGHGSEKIRRLITISEIMANKAMNWLFQPNNRCPSCKKTDGWFCEGTIGWGIPMMTLAIDAYKKNDLHAKKLNNLGLDKTIHYLYHDNFRVRSLSAWVLARILKK